MPVTPTLGARGRAISWIVVVALVLVVLGLKTADAQADIGIAPPSNDNFPGQNITAMGPHSIAPGNNVAATGQVGEPKIAGSVADRTVWYTWTVPVDGWTTLNLRDATFDTTLGVFTGNSVGSLTSVTFNNDMNGTPQSKVTFLAKAGTVYRIAVDGMAAATGPFKLQFSTHPPQNDNLAKPQSLEWEFGQIQASTTSATGEPAEPHHHGSRPERTLWYSWTAAKSGPVVFNTHKSSFDTVLAVYTGTSFTDLTTVASNDDLVGSTSEVNFNAVQGTTYRIVVHGFNGAFGEVRLQWSAVQPANDDLAKAKVLTGLTGVSSQTTTGATHEGNEPDAHGNATSDTSVWFRVTPPKNGPVVVSVPVNDELMIYPRLAVYTGSNYVTLKPVADGKYSVTFDGVANTPYHIAVVGFPESTGNFVIQHEVGICNGLVATIIGKGAVAGTAGDDVIVGSTSDDTIDGGAGNDTICGMSGDDTIKGATGNDTLVGGTGADSLFGEAGMDALKLVDWVAGNDNGDGGTETDTATMDAEDTVVNVP